MAEILKLDQVKNIDDLKNLKVEKKHFRENWLYGFGWNENYWEKNAPINKFVLDQIFPDFPIFFSRCDGHASLLNTKGLVMMGMDINHSGLLNETEHMIALSKLPEFSDMQITNFLEQACSIFNRAGFTHVRDLSASLKSWELLVKLAAQEKLTVAYEAHFTCNELKDFDRILNEVILCRKNEGRYLKSRGIKIYYDGTLGSSTALISLPYYGVKENGCGVRLWSLPEVKKMMIKAWTNDVEFSVHTIGDQAVHEIVTLARQVSAEGYVGQLNLEHVEMVRNETIQLMKPLHVRCHLQPCHWLSDRMWIKEKTDSLYSTVFQWEALRRARIPMSFGSDAPIESASFFNNKAALNESSKHGIEKLKDKIENYHSYPDPWLNDTYTEIFQQQIQRVVFDGRTIFQNCLEIILN